MKSELQNIIDEIYNLSPMLNKDEEGYKAYCITNGIDSLIEELDKGEPVCKYFETLDSNLVKIIRLLYQVGKEKTMYPEYNFKKYGNDDDKINRLKLIFSNLLDDSKDIDITAMHGDYAYKYIQYGFSVVFEG